MAKAKTYRAIERGYDGKKLREVGEIFTTDIEKGSWMEEVGDDGKAIQAAEIAASQSERADPDYESLNKTALTAIAAEKGVPHDGLTKAELVDALNAVNRGK